ncbi:protoglobin domain-containing protein [Botryobacter ruber]|uniref:protoglobin domain-containing protein n=1 Tax=Botryobacter ruber TaxID=2171629 RepID=UPI000E0C1776|nr:protoglobin domain-containing protein [Botryobacter ruber]
MDQIKGYAYGQVGTSPVTLEDLNLLKKTVLFTEEDEKYLRMAGDVLKDQTDQVLDLWYNYVGSNEHLLYYFSKDGQPNTQYLDAVRARFKQWILDLCNRPYDQEWLNYQHEIALRHHSTRKNKTDHVDTAPIVHYRYIVAFIYPITATIKGFLSKKGHDAETVAKMHDAWFKAVTLTAILWTHPYINKGEF